MTRAFLLIAFVSMQTLSFSQKLSASLFVGGSYYQGDLQPKSFTTNQTHPAFGVGALYEITDKVYGRFNFKYGTISGDDKKNPENVKRNLSFTSSITDFQLGAEYHFMDIHQSNFTPYIFAGVSYFHYNPKATDRHGNKVALQPLSTEGEGFLSGVNPYK